MGEMTQLLLLAGMSRSSGARATQSGAEAWFAFSPFPLLLGSLPDDPKDHETKALFSWPCAQEWPGLSSLSHLPSEDDQIMSNTSRLLGTQETPHSSVPRPPRAPAGLVSPSGFRGGPAPSGCFLEAHIQGPKAEHTNGRPRLPPEATYNRKAHLLQPDRKSGFFSATDLTHRRWSRAFQKWGLAGEGGRKSRGEWVWKAVAPSSVCYFLCWGGGGFWLLASWTSQSSGVW